MKSKSGIFTNISFLIIGVLLGAFASWIISSHYYTESSEAYKRGVIESTIHEIDFNLTDKLYEEYQDTIKYIGGGGPFSYLQAGALNQLYLNLGVFKKSDSYLFADLEDRLAAAKINVELFNQVVQFRNNYIFIDLKNVKSFNPMVFENYFKYVLPSLQKLKEFLIENRETLVR